MKIIASPDNPDDSEEWKRLEAELRARYPLIFRKKPEKKRWKGLKKWRVLAYLRGIARKSKNIWTWINVNKIANRLEVSEKTVWRVIKNLADQEQGIIHDNQISVRLCQRETRKNFHFQWMIAERKRLLYDREPLFIRADGKKRHLRLRCRKKNLPGTRTKNSESVNQQKIEPTPPATAAAKNDWMRQVPALEQVFWALNIPTYEKTDPLGGRLYGKKRIWTHSPWKKEGDSTPSCLIYADENRFYDFSTRRGGNAITLARIHHNNPAMPFQAAFEWLKSCRPRLTSPAAWWNPNPSPPTAFDQFLENLKPGGGKKLEKPPRREGLYRLAWSIYRRQFAGVSIPYIKPKGVVSLIVKALNRQYEKGSIEEAIQESIASWRLHSQFIEPRYHFLSNLFGWVKWRHRDLRQAEGPEYLIPLFSMAFFLKELRSNLDKAFKPSKVSPPVERNKDPIAIEMCRNQIQNLFKPLEYVWITNSVRHRGWCRTAQFWLDDIAQNGVPMGPEGALIKQNPMSRYGTGNDEVQSFRHCLCEADGLSIQEQIELSKKLPYPIVSATFSGGKSIHFIVKISGTKETYAAIVEQLHQQFPQFDRACKDPARWTRLAGAMRNGVVQAALPIS